MIDILFVDNGRQEEIDRFYEACQRQRDYYRGYAKAPHPLSYFAEPQFAGACPLDMTTVYLSYPMSHVKYKQPVVLPHSLGRTSGVPALPGRTLAPRYNKAACQLYKR